MCTPRPDAGPLDGATSIDAPASGADAGMPAGATGGCGVCAGRRTPLGTVLGVLVGVAVLRRARRKVAHHAA